MKRKSNHTTADFTEFISLLTDHQSALRSFLHSMIPQDDVRDVLQNTNIALWERRESFAMGTNFQAWAITIARYRALEHRKTLKKQRKFILSDDVSEFLAMEPFDRSPGLIEEKRIALRSCLALLKARDRELIHARYHSKASLAEYAKTDGRSAASLRVILNRLRSVLHDCISRKLETGTSEI